MSGYISERGGQPGKNRLKVARTNARDRAPTVGKAQAVSAVRVGAEAEASVAARDAAPCRLSPGDQTGYSQGPAIDRQYAKAKVTPDGSFCLMTHVTFLALGRI